MGIETFTNKLHINEPFVLHIGAAVNHLFTDPARIEVLREHRADEPYDYPGVIVEGTPFRCTVRLFVKEQLLSITRIERGDPEVVRIDPIDGREIAKFSVTLAPAYTEIVDTSLLSM